MQAATPISTPFSHLFPHPLPHPFSHPFSQHHRALLVQDFFVDKRAAGQLLVLVLEVE